MIKTVQEIIIVSAENYGSFLDMYPVHFKETKYFYKIHGQKKKAEKA